MYILVVGLSHKTASVEIREGLNFHPGKLPEALDSLQKGHGEILECAIVSTCNRVEVYAVTRKENASKAVAGIKKFLHRYHSTMHCRFEDTLYTYIDIECISHLFAVAAGLDSMVCGESEITGQIKKAYEVSGKEGTAKIILHALFQKALATAKEIRTHTKVGRKPVSVSSIAVELAERLIKNISSASVMVLGAGKTSETTLRYLASKGICSIMVSNRSYERAQELADRINGRAIRYGEFLQALSEVDIVISSTAAPHVVITAEDVQAAMARRSRKSPLLFIDIAVPRDVDPAVGTIKNVFLYNIDDLKGLADENMKSRQKEISYSKAIVEKKTDELIQWLGHLEQKPTIVKLQNKIEQVRVKELDKTLRKLKHVSPQEREEIAYLTKRMASQFFHPIIKKIKEDKVSSHGLDYFNIVHELFSLDDIETSGYDG